MNFIFHVIEIALLVAVLIKVRQITEGQETAMKELDDLQLEVQQVTEVEQSAITLIQGLSDQIKAAGTNPAALKALTDQLDASKTQLASAVAANTPAAP
jgi:hypothetical protein